MAEKVFLLTSDEYEKFKSYETYMLEEYYKEQRKVERNIPHEVFKIGNYSFTKADHLKTLIKHLL